MLYHVYVTVVTRSRAKKDLIQLDEVFLLRIYYVKLFISHMNYFLQKYEYFWVLANDLGFLGMN